MARPYWTPRSGACPDFPSLGGLRRYPDSYGRAPSGARLNRQNPVDDRRAFAPACNAGVPLVGGARVRIEPIAVIFYDRSHEVAAAFDADAHVLGGSVLVDVGHRFLDDAVDRRFDGWR